MARGRPSRAWATVAVGLIVAAVLLGLGLPRLLAAWLLLPGDPGMAIIAAGQLPDRDGFERILTSRTRAAHWVEAPDTLVDLGIAHLSLAQSSLAGLVSERRAEHMQTAVQHLRAGLTRAPVDPHGWTYLAFLHTAAGNHAAAAQALDLALRTGPYEPELALPRAALALANFDWLGPDTLGPLTREFSVAFELAPARFVRDVLDSGRAGAVREIFAAWPARRDHFDRMARAAGAPTPAGE